jgi:protein tyrosine/serine phosphatase
MVDPQQSNPRHLAWEGCYNVRDLGGLPTVDGGRTRWRAIIRADLLGRLTPKGQQQLLDYGVQTILDLRSPQEVEEKPSAIFPEQILAPAYLNLWPSKNDTSFKSRIRQAKTRAEVYNLVLDHDPEGVAEVLRSVANAQPGGVVIHCHSGKDRTGIISAVLLSLAGVPPAPIAEDYTLSQARLWPLYEKTLEEAGGEIKDDPWLAPTVTPETMLAMLAHVRTHYGGLPQYLYEGGLSPEEVNRVKQRLSGESANFP